MTAFAEYVLFAEDYLEQNPEQRKGQAYFNALWFTYPDLADKVRGSHRDPFYNDDRMPEFLDFVLAELPEEETE